MTTRQTGGMCHPIPTSRKFSKRMIELCLSILSMRFRKSLWTMSNITSRPSKASKLGISHSRMQDVPLAMGSNLSKGVHVVCLHYHVPGPETRGGREVGLIVAQEFVCRTHLAVGTVRTPGQTRLNPNQPVLVAWLMVVSFWKV